MPGCSVAGRQVVLGPHSPFTLVQVPPCAQSEISPAALPRKLVGRNGSHDASRTGLTPSMTLVLLIGMTGIWPAARMPCTAARTLSPTLSRKTRIRPAVVGYLSIQTVPPEAVVTGIVVQQLSQFCAPMP